MRISILVVLFSFSIICVAQSWKPASGFWPNQDRDLNNGFSLYFKENGPLGRDWIYGGYLDKDSLRRCVSYREAGEWKALPFSCQAASSSNSIANDIEMYGDTLYIAGVFVNVKRDGDTNVIPMASILKWYNDSLWAGTLNIFDPDKLSSHGDTLLIWGGYYDPPQLIHPQFMTDNRGKTWKYPYAIIHPTLSTPGFGAVAGLKILSNGDILTLNNGDRAGLSRWDGAQWHSYGNPLQGSLYVYALDFDFYRDELYMGGTFSKVATFNGDTVETNPLNPGNGIARWDRNAWSELGGGILEGAVKDIIVHNDVLYCALSSGYPDKHRFGDKYIQYFAGWNGLQWCGTPTQFDDPPKSFGFLDDTLYVTFNYATSIGGSDSSYIFYFDGDYLHGPNSICSTPGLGEEEIVFTNDEVKTYPNPVQDELHISLSENISEATYQLLALDGKLVKEGKLKAGENTLTVSEKLNGVFLLKLSSFGGEIVRKVVFEN